MVTRASTRASTRHHGGDGDDDGCETRSRTTRIESPCETAPIKKGRGPNVNKKLDKVFKKNGKKPLPLSYSGNTYKIVGDYESLFTRKLSSEVKERAEFHYKSWAKVPASVKRPIYTTMQYYFDLKSLQESEDWPLIQEHIHLECSRAYRERKYEMHTWFKKNGGLDNLNQARSKPFKNMDSVSWDVMIDEVFRNEKFIEQSKANISNRAQHQYTSSHGSASYAQQLYKLRKDETVAPENAGPIQVWYNNHVKPKPNDVLLKELWGKIQKMRSTMKNTEAQEDGSVDEVECLRRVLGSKRGFQPGVGRVVRSREPDIGSSSSSSTHMNQDIEERVMEKMRQEMNQQMTQQVNQQVNQQMQQFMDQIRTMNPSLILPKMPSETLNDTILFSFLALK